MRRPSERAHVPQPSTSSMPASWIRSIRGVKAARSRVAASSASTMPSFSRRKRASSASCRFSDCTSKALERPSSATAPSDPLRRRFSRDAWRTSRENRRAASQKRGATRSETSARSQLIRKSAPVKKRIRTIAENPSAAPPSRKLSIAWTSPVSRASTSPRRRRRARRASRAGGARTPARGRAAGSARRSTSRARRLRTRARRRRGSARRRRGRRAGARRGPRARARRRRRASARPPSVGYGLRAGRRISGGGETAMRRP